MSLFAPAWEGWLRIGCTRPVFVYGKAEYTKGVDHENLHSVKSGTGIRIKNVEWSSPISSLQHGKFGLLWSALEAAGVQVFYLLSRR